MRENGFESEITEDMKPPSAWTGNRGEMYRLDKNPVKQKRLKVRFLWPDCGKNFPKWQVCSHFPLEIYCWVNYSKGLCPPQKALPKGSRPLASQKINHSSSGLLFALI